MCDNCANEWGCSLAILPRSKRTSPKDLSCENVQEDLKREVAKCLGNKFVLARVTSCGSDANLLAIAAATGGDTSLCLIASGSYIAGDGGELQSWSTSTFSSLKGPSSITPPHHIHSPFTRSHTIALPYAIPGVSDSATIEQYENECLSELHVRCLIAKLKGVPSKCIVMELMLASNGAALSDRALSMIGKLAEKHDLHIVVDEVMTGGRTGTMLMTLTKPEAFTNRVTHVTLGKWTLAGIVLESSEFNSSKAWILDHTTKRGTSTLMDCRGVLATWKAVSENMGVANLRRSQVLKKLHVDEEAAWGEGCLIFAPVRRNGLTHGTKNRFLPLLSYDTPIDNLDVHKMTKWSKENVNNRIMESVRTWMNFRADADEVDNKYRTLVTYLATCKENDSKSMQEIKAEIFPEFSTTNVSTVLRVAESAGLLSYKLTGLKRHRCWHITQGCLPTYAVESAEV